MCRQGAAALTVGHVGGLGSLHLIFIHDTEVLFSVSRLELDAVRSQTAEFKLN